MLLDGNFFVATVLASTLTKISLKYSALEGPSVADKNRLNAQCMLFMTSIVNLGKSGLPKTAMDADSYDRIMACLRVLSDPTPEVQKIFGESCHTVRSPHAAVCFCPQQADLRLGVGVYSYD